MSVAPLNHLLGRRVRLEVGVLVERQHGLLDGLELDVQRRDPLWEAAAAERVEGRIVVHHGEHDLLGVVHLDRHAPRNLLSVRLRIGHVGAQVLGRDALGVANPQQDRRVCRFHVDVRPEMTEQQATDLPLQILQPVREEPSGDLALGEVVGAADGLLTQNRREEGPHGGVQLLHALAAARARAHTPWVERLELIEREAREVVHRARIDLLLQLQNRRARRLLHGCWRRARRLLHGCRL
eukprot:1577283-Prymnesium_polylepis.1